MSRALRIKLLVYFEESCVTSLLPVRRSLGWSGNLSHPSNDVHGMGGGGGGDCVTSPKSVCVTSPIAALLFWDHH